MVRHLVNVWMRVGAHNHVYIATRSAPQAIDMFGICRSWVNH
jgi:hypothetical protein